jgi:hypothetical protein
MKVMQMILHFKGELTFRIIGQLITSLNSKKNQFDIETGVFKKIMSLLIEVLENIYKYSDHYTGFIQKSPAYQPEFQLSGNENGYIIRAVNPVRQDDIYKLRKKIDLINNLNPEDMRILYRKTLTNGEFTDKGGAGLGFFEMVKISGHIIRYKFDKISDKFSNFELLLYIENHKAE